jgi:hypothetical protein
VRDVGEKLIGEVVSYSIPPTVKPPENCINPETWKLAFELHSQHQPDSERQCSRCGGVFPCAGHRLAAQGFATSVGEANDNSLYWKAFTVVRVNHGRSIATS